MPEPFHLIRFEGHLDISRYPEFRAAFEGIPAGTPVLVDLSLAESVDSTFLSEMFLLNRRHDGPFAVIIPAKGDVLRMFAITGMDAKIRVYSDLATAVAGLGLAPVPERDGEELAPG